MRATIDDVRRRTDAAISAGAHRPRVFVAEWIDPPFVPGHWLPEMIEAAGGEALLGEPGRPSHPTTWDDVAAADPEVVVIAPCGFGVDEAVRQGCAVVAPTLDSNPASKHTGRVKATIDLDDDLYRAIKVEAARLDRSVREIVNEALEAWLAKQEDDEDLASASTALEEYRRDGGEAAESWFQARAAEARATYGTDPAGPPRKR